MDYFINRTAPENQEMWHFVLLASKISIPLHDFGNIKLMEAEIFDDPKFGFQMSLDDFQ